MCTSPITIRNPHYQHLHYASAGGACIEVPRQFRPTQKFIEVSCGKCAECRDSYYSSILQRALVESRTSYMYFVTLTYNNDHLPTLNLPNLGQVYYTNYGDLQNLFKRFRKRDYLAGREYRYLAVNEYGDKFHRPHIHLIIFVARLSDDTSSTPYMIERNLFNNILREWVINTGTRKNPLYEPLLTYRTRRTSKGIKTNYFVKYVEPPTTLETTDADTYVKTIQYLIGYVQKGSSFDKTVEKYLSTLEDPFLVRKLSNILRSKVRYSKGFGCGFVDGRRHYMPRTFVSTSLATILYTDYYKNLPKTVNEFVELYPDVADDLSDFIVSDRYANYRTLQDALSHFTTYEYTMHCLYLKYYPLEFAEVNSRYTSTLSAPTIGYLFKNLRARVYARCRVSTSAMEISPTFQYLREGIAEGLRQKLPYFAFPIPSSGKYTSLCRFYKERVLTLDDYYALYGRLGVQTYEEWQKLFEHEITNKKALKAEKNKYSHEKFNEIVCISQKKYLDLPRRFELDDIYHMLT